MLALVPLAAASAGCPPQSASPQAPAASLQGAGCPAPENIYMASYLTRESEDAGAPGDPSSASPSNAPSSPSAGGYTGWVLPLHHRKVDAVADQPEYANVDPDTARSLGVPAAPLAIWLMAPGQPPCRATAGSYYAAAVDAPANVTYGVELRGCPAPPAEQQQVTQAIAMVSETAPTDCQIGTPQPVAARLGETNAQNQWQRPAKETPIPPALAAAIPSRDCRPPGCEPLWAIAEVSVASRAVAWAGAVNWLTIPPNAAPDTQCDWKVETFAGFFVAGSDGRAVKVTEGQEPPLLLGAVLADRSGPRALIAEGPGVYAIYDLAGGVARLARRVVWLLVPLEDAAVDERIGPVCNAPAPAP